MSMRSAWAASTSISTPGQKRYALRDGLRLLEAAKKTPVVDGSGLKNTLEREAIKFVQTDLGIELRGKHVLMVSALDRFGMAQALVEAGADVLFGDFIFALDLDKPVRGLTSSRSWRKNICPTHASCRFNFSIRRATNKTGRPNQSIRNIMKKPTLSRATSIHASVHAGSS